MQVEIDVIAGPATGKRFTFDEPDCFLFGRALDARISLPGDPYVSRQHFLLEISPPECKITDLESKNGTFINGIRYGGRKPLGGNMKQAPDGIREAHLKDGDEIGVGDTYMKVTIVSSQYVLANNATTLSQAARPAKWKVFCIRCMNDVTTEAGLRGQVEGAEYVCKACRTEDSGSHINVLQDLLKEAVEKKAVPGAPVIEGFQIEELISRGGMGMIYKANDVETGLPVAVKTMLPHVATDPESIQIFQREIEITRQLDHPNIVHLFKHGRADGIFYFILEYVEGMDLGALLDSQSSPLSFEEAAPIMFGTLDGLAHAHAATMTVNVADETSKTYTGIVHRDLKPQNILLTRKGTGWVPKLTDFGISKSFESAGLTDITAPGEVLGTPMYWPREQITHYKFLHPATDVFSVAAVFYEMLTKAWVREGFTDLFEECKRRNRYPGIADYMNVISGNPTVPIREQNPGIPEPVARVIDHALQEAEVPHDNVKMQNMLASLRYPDARAFRDALANAFLEVGLEQASFMMPGTDPDLRVKHAQAEVTQVALASHTVQSENVSSDDQDEQAPIMGSIVYTIAAQQVPEREVALFVLDLVHSTEFVLDFGDTYFSTLIGNIYKIAHSHSSRSELVFMKNTGDGFLAVFKSIPAAFSLALTFLETYSYQDIRLRIALHWGAVKSGPGGDVLGREVHRVCRVEGVQDEDRLKTSQKASRLPLLNRILITQQGLKQLDESIQQQFSPVGKFKLKGFNDPSELWVLHRGREE